MVDKSFTRSFDEMEQKVERHEDAIEKISKLSDIFDLLGTNSKTNIDIIVKHACQLLDGVCCLYNRLDNSNESLIAWAHHNLPSDYACEDHPEGHICYEATIKGGTEPVIISDITQTAYQKSDSNVTKYNLKSYLGFPVSLRGESIGALCIVDTKKREFAETDIQIISTLAKALSIEEERKHAEEEIQKLQKLKSIGLLAGGIAHDFNNILVGLFGNISMAKLKLPPDHPSYAFLEKAEQSMDRATNLTTQLLTFAKGGVPIKKSLQLGKLLKDLVHFDLFGSKVTPIFEAMDDLWLIEADKGQIQQVFSNLTINALNAMPNGGNLFFTTKNVHIQNQTIPNLAEGKYVKITIRDQGIGIDKEHISSIFDPYFTTKQSGFGLGLATVYSIITSHNGHISVQSELRKGATFTIYLPASASQEKPASEQAALKESGKKQLGKKILVMDDDDMNREMATVMLQECGYLVATAPDGKRAIDMYQQSLKDGEPFAAIILDLSIPGGIGGKEVIQKILAIDPDVRAIVCSGYSDDPVLANYLDYGFKGIAAKPYTISTLQDALQQALS